MSVDGMVIFALGILEFAYLASLIKSAHLLAVGEIGVVLREEIDFTRPFDGPGQMYALPQCLAGNALANNAPTRI